MEPAPLRDKLLPLLESKGAIEVRRMLRQKKFHGKDISPVNEWLLRQEEDSESRSEKRSLWALRISIIAMILSASAITINNAEKISQFMSWFSK